AALDRPLDGIRRHVRLAGALDSEAEAGVRFWIRATTFTCRNRDLTPQFGEQLTPFGVSDPLRALDLRPLRMAGHDWFLPWDLRCYDAVYASTLQVFGSRKV